MLLVLPVCQAWLHLQPGEIAETNESLPLTTLWLLCMLLWNLLRLPTLTSGLEYERRLYTGPGSKAFQKYPGFGPQATSLFHCHWCLCICSRKMPGTRALFLLSHTPNTAPCSSVKYLCLYPPCLADISTATVLPPPPWWLTVDFAPPVSPSLSLEFADFTVHVIGQPSKLTPHLLQLHSSRNTSAKLKSQMFTRPAS